MSKCFKKACNLY